MKHIYIYYFIFFKLCEPFSFSSVISLSNNSIQVNSAFEEFDVLIKFKGFSLISRVARNRELRAISLGVNWIGIIVR
jgi:hypothetical protein